MSGDPHCPACGFEWVKSAPNPVAHVCTGRPGCVRADPDRETPAPESDPAGADVPDGKADIVERLQAGTVISGARWPGDTSPPVDECMTDDLMAEAADALVAKDAEIARLRAENERLTGERDDARRLLEEAKTLIGTLQWSLEWEKEGRRKDRAQAEADRAALAQRVAEAVRCRALLIVDLRDRARIRAIDLGPIVAAALKESAP